MVAIDTAIPDCDGVSSGCFEQWNNMVICSNNPNLTTELVLSQIKFLYFLFSEKVLHFPIQFPRGIPNPIFFPVGSGVSRHWH